MEKIKIEIESPEYLGKCEIYSNSIWGIMERLKGLFI